MIDLSSLKADLSGKPVYVVGLGKSGIPVVEACRRSGLEVWVWDDGAASYAGMSDCVHNPADVDFSTVGLLCLSPGIPLTHPKPHLAVEKARAAGVDVVGDMELFHRVKKNVVTIGITGTNGKSTTTALIGHILATAKVPSAVGGNIGTGVLELPDLSADSVYVFEISSYQADLCTSFSPDVSVLINISPDHLDRHGDMAGYTAAKERLFRGAGHAVIGIEDDFSRGVYTRVLEARQRKVVPVSCLERLSEGISVDEEGILFNGVVSIVDLKTCPNLQGQHNWQNAAMAYAACRAVGVSTADIVKGLQTYGGLAHRQNIVATLNGVTYVNDSKATNDQAAAMALRTFNPIYWIAGGKSKGGGYADCEKHLDRVHHAFLIGQAEEELAQWLQKKGKPFTRCGTMENAVQAAKTLAEKESLPNAVVLLSPACASFDQFKGFEHRGDVFVGLVGALQTDAHAPLKKKEAL